MNILRRYTLGAPGGPPLPEPRPVYLPPRHTGGIFYPIGLIPSPRKHPPGSGDSGGGSGGGGGGGGSGDECSVIYFIPQCGGGTYYDPSRCAVIYDICNVIA